MGFVWSKICGLLTFAFWFCFVLFICDLVLVTDVLCVCGFWWFCVLSFWFMLVVGFVFPLYLEFWCDFGFWGCL